MTDHVEDSSKEKKFKKGKEKRKKKKTRKKKGFDGNCNFRSFG